MADQLENDIKAHTNYLTAQRRADQRATDAWFRQMRAQQRSEKIERILGAVGTTLKWCLWGCGILFLIYSDPPLYVYAICAGVWLACYLIRMHETMNAQRAALERLYQRLGGGY